MEGIVEEFKGVVGAAALGILGTALPILSIIAIPVILIFLGMGIYMIWQMMPFLIVMIVFFCSFLLAQKLRIPGPWNLVVPLILAFSALFPFFVGKIKDFALARSAAAAAQVGFPIPVLNVEIAPLGFLTISLFIALIASGVWAFIRTGSWSALGVSITVLMLAVGAASQAGQDVGGGIVQTGNFGIRFTSVKDTRGLGTVTFDDTRWHWETRPFGPWNDSESWGTLNLPVKLDEDLDPNQPPTPAPDGKYYYYYRVDEAKLTTDFDQERWGATMDITATVQLYNLSGWSPSVAEIRWTDERHTVSPTRTGISAGGEFTIRIQATGSDEATIWMKVTSYKRVFVPEGQEPPKPDKPTQVPPLLWLIPISMIPTAASIVIAKRRKVL
jgi:hypothetical protein